MRRIDFQKFISQKAERKEQKGSAAAVVEQPKER